MASATAWRTYRDFKTALGLKKVNLSSDTIKMALFLSTSNAGDVDLATAEYATLTNQHGNQSGSGYLTGGKTCTATWTETAGTLTFDVDDAVWTATGGSITARFAVLYSDTSTNKDLICYCILDSTPADVTATAGNTFTVAIHTNGVFTMAGGEA
jgi:hypothetical protein